MNFSPAATKAVPTNLISGFLGVGKTTAIRYLLAHKPQHERWAVLVNEFGEIGIDGATLDNDQGVDIREVAGGCVCCTSGPMLRVALTRLLRQRPDRLLIEPTGLGHPAGILDTLREPGLAQALQLNAVITLVDPVQFLDDKYRQHPVYADQISLADVLLASKSDRYDAATLQQFQQQADELYPPKQLVASIENGAIDAAWLDLGSTSQRTAEHPDAHRKLLSPLQPRTGHTEPLTPSADEPLICRSNHGLGSHSCGWLFAPQFQFHLKKLKHWADDLAELAAAQQVPLTRAKGVFRCGDKWWWLNWTPQDHSWQAIAWRRDSRCELIAADSAGEPDWQAFASSLLSTLSVDPRINN